MSNGYEDTVYSYSRLGSFNNCPFSYNLSYNEENRGNDSIYTFLGSSAHEIIESLQKGLITNDVAIDMFLDKVDECDLIGLEFMNDNVRSNYINNIIHYLKEFTPIKGDFVIEEEVFVNIGDYKLRGFIDIYVKCGNEILILDYKTSSKFSSKELPLSGRQLVLYGIALEQKYPDCTISAIGWDMLKYVIVEGKRGPKLIERREVESQEYDNYGQAIVYHKYNSETKRDCIEYIIDTITRIENATEFPPLDIKKEYFYCKNLCGHKHLCPHYKNYNKQRTYH